MFIYYQPNPCGRSVGDCAVRAISAALRLSWEESFDILTKFARNMCDMPSSDQLCNDKIEEKNDLIQQLRAELLYTRGQTSQDIQTAAIQAGQRTLANEIEQYVLPTPRPAYIVQNPNCCQNYGGCGCGM